MNRTMIIYILGCILKTEGVLMALPCLVALIYHESQGIAYVIVGSIKSYCRYASDNKEA